MKIFLLIYTLLSLSASTLSAEAPALDAQNIPLDQAKKQNVRIAKLAAKEMSKTLPQKIDKFTTLKNITNESSTLIYTFVINSGAKSDAAIKKEDHSRMEKAVLAGVCKSSERFLKSEINISYVYMSAQTDKLLFRFDITKEKCNYPVAR